MGLLRANRWGAAVYDARVSRLPRLDPDRAHYQKCKSQRTCLRCRWATFKASYTARFPWLECVQRADGSSRMVCYVCRDAAAADGKLGELSTSACARHEATDRHKAAVQKLRGKVFQESGKELVQGKVVPEATAFLRVLTETRANNLHSKDGLPGVGKRLKLQRMRWCLAEALRKKARESFLKSEVASLHQDVRRGMLSVRYRVADINLHISRGTLGQINLAKHFDFTAQGIKAGTIAIIKEFCRPRSAPPRGLRHRGLFNKGLYNRLCRRVELFDADAASDEQLAGALLANSAANAAFASSSRWEPIADDYKVALPNIKLFNKDTTHAARRISSRTLMQDSYMKEVMCKFVTLKSAVAQRIQRSALFSERFRSNIEHLDNDIARKGIIKNLRAAKHRHESLQKPLGRAVLFWKAVLLTAEQICNERFDRPEGPGLRCSPNGMRGRPCQRSDPLYNTVLLKTPRAH